MKREGVRKSRTHSKASHNSKIGQDFFTNLPQEIIIDVFSRLPIRTILRCKCVCKSWRDLVKCREFATSHLSKSSSGLVIYSDRRFPKPYKMVGLVDELSVHRFFPFSDFGFGFPHLLIPHSSTNGLLFMHGLGRSIPDYLLICNPITREYIKLPPPPLESLQSCFIFGFGVSKMTDQYKLVGITTLDLFNYEWNGYPQQKCDVFTLATGLWTSIAADTQLIYCTSVREFQIGKLFSGNLHWLVYDDKYNRRISCLDLETEIFTSFSPPPLPRLNLYDIELYDLDDCLCLCENKIADGEIVMWSMKEYGDEKSWTKKFAIRDPVIHRYAVPLPVKIFKDGDILFHFPWYDNLCCYSNKTRTFIGYSYLEARSFCGKGGVVSYTPSFLSLKTLTMENVGLF